MNRPITICVKYESMKAMGEMFKLSLQLRAKRMYADPIKRYHVYRFEDLQNFLEFEKFVSDNKKLKIGYIRGIGEKTNPDPEFIEEISRAVNAAISLVKSQPL